ncbi:MAG: hypothetical protein HY680_02415 [Chloroflexi bacterium]|nr:hypothetical protein [Chloroflexota bacterium]
MQNTLRPYQLAIGRAVLDSVLHRRGLTFTVEIARQGGKNELSAQLEVLLLTLFMAQGGNLVKGAPTYVPQLLHSILRLKDRLGEAGYGGLWSKEALNIFRLGKARQVFLSAQPSARVVGATAHILLEIDEAQEVEKAKFYKEFRPMGASTNVTTLLYGTPWDGDSLLEEAKAHNLDLERRDGVKRHFQYDWQEVARHNPLYGAYVEGERERLGESHPLFRSQYLLLPVHTDGGLLSGSQRAQLQGDHPRQHAPSPGAAYVAALDVAGGVNDGSLSRAEASAPGRDSTVLTLGELDFAHGDPTTGEPQVRIVEHRWWTGVALASLHPQLVDLLGRVWRPRRVAVDATGLGQGTASFLERALGSGVVEPFTFTAGSKSRLGYDLLAAVNSGRLKLYAPDGSQEFGEFWRQLERAESHLLPNRTMAFAVASAKGHDDFLMSLALLVHAGRYLPRVARGRAREAAGAR